MLGLTSLEVYISVLNMTNESNKFEISKPIRKKEKWYSLDVLKIVDEHFGPKDFKDELWKPVVIHEWKQSEFGDIRKMKKYSNY